MSVIREGHFPYESGRHGPQYVEKFRLLERPSLTDDLCGRIADVFRHLNAEIVVGPTTGGMLLAQATARALDALSYCAEPDHENGGRVFGRGFTFEPGQPVIVVDDVLTTGGSVRDTIEAVRERGGDPVAVGVVVDRTNGMTTPDGRFDGLPFFACLSIEVPSYPVGECPLCESGVPLTIT